jgi:hypothetical protein
MKYIIFIQLFLRVRRLLCTLEAKRGKGTGSILLVEGRHGWLL